MLYRELGYSNLQQVMHFYFFCQNINLNMSISPHLCPGLHAAAKIAIFRVLRKIVSVTIFCVGRDFSLFLVMLITTKPERVADLTKFAKIAKNRYSDDFLRCLRFFAVLCHVNNQ